MAAPGTRTRSSSRTRTIAAIFAHMHHVRRKWIRLSAPHFPLPAELDRNCTQAQARKALRASGARCMEMIEQLLTSSPDLSSSSKKLPKFLRDGWARAWPAGPMMVAYMITHEAHHRGQVCMLANQLGFKLPGAVTSGMWRWEGMDGNCQTHRPRFRQAPRQVDMIRSRSLALDPADSPE